MSLNIKALDPTQISDNSCCNNSAVSSYGAISTCKIMAFELCIDGVVIFILTDESLNLFEVLTFPLQFQSIL